MINNYVVVVVVRSFMPVCLTRQTSPHCCRTQDSLPPPPPSPPLPPPSPPLRILRRTPWRRRRRTNRSAGYHRIIILSERETKIVTFTLLKGQSYEIDFENVDEKLTDLGLNKGRGRFFEFFGVISDF
jgi:hypothetical protein